MLGVGGATRRRSCVRRRWLASLLVVLALSSAVSLSSVVPVSAATRPFPILPGLELKALYSASLPLPRTAPLPARPALSGHAGADHRTPTPPDPPAYPLQVTPPVRPRPHD